MDTTCEEVKIIGLELSWIAAFRLIEDTFNTLLQRNYELEKRVEELELLCKLPQKK